jgi:septal ring factor EnvC (AmiA/AmiB activator)
MIRKVVLGGALALGLSWLMLGNGVFHYLGTSWNWMQSSVQEQVPVAMKVERARQLIEEIEPEIRRQVHVIAETERGVADLDKQIASLEQDAETLRNVVYRQESDLRTGGPFHYAGHSYTETEVRRDLRLRLARLEQREEHLAKLQDLRNARREHHQAAVDRLQAMKIARDEATQRLAMLETEIERVRLRQAESDFDYGDSTTLSELQGLLGKMESYVDAEQRYASDKLPEEGLIPTEAVESGDKDVLDAVARYREAKTSDTQRVATGQTVSTTTE